MVVSTSLGYPIILGGASKLTTITIIDSLEPPVTAHSAIILYLEQLERIYAASVLTAYYIRPKAAQDKGLPYCWKSVLNCSSSGPDAPYSGSYTISMRGDL